LPLNVAWFRPAHPDPHNPLDETAALTEALAGNHTVEIFDAARAHDFVWMQVRRRFDVCVYELADTPDHQFIWPYLLRYPGILLLHDESLQAGRARALWRQGRMDDYAVEFTYDRGVPPPRHPAGVLGVVEGGWPMLRAPLVASHLTVVRSHSFAADLRESYPGVAVRHAPIGVRRPETTTARAGGRVRVGVIGAEESALARLQRLVERADLDLMTLGRADLAQFVSDSDIMVAFQWPARREPPVAALVAMAAGTPTVAFETDATAGWPALDPQTWQPRDRVCDEPPALVSIDPRDEDHSFGLAFRRLGTDAALRASLGDDAEAWWRAHATVEAADNAWQVLLAEAALMGDRPAPPDWPVHLSADGSEHAHEIARQFGVDLNLPGFGPPSR